MQENTKRQDVLQILPIRQVHESRRVEISTFQASLGLRLDPIAALVLPAKQETQRGDEDNLEQMADDHGPDSELVGWAISTCVQGEFGLALCVVCRANLRLVCLVEERTCDVAGAVAQEQHGVGDDFLCVACSGSSAMSLCLGSLED